MPLALLSLLAGSVAEAQTIGDAEKGRALIASRGCGACHSVPGVRGERSFAAPPLDHLRQRAFIAGVLPNAPGNLVAWLLDPGAILPDNAMPDTGLSEAEAWDIAAYLYTLK